MALFSKKKDDTFRKLMLTSFQQDISRINNKKPHIPLINVGPNVLRFADMQGTYFITDDTGTIIGAAYVAGYRDFICYGLDESHADIIKNTILHIAIVDIGITPVQTLDGSMPDSLRDALGFIGPEKDEYTRTKRWVIR